MPTCTLAYLLAHIAHAIPGGVSSALPPETTTAAAGTFIVNQAGRHMFSRPWKFRTRPPTTLSLVSAQNYITLPTDYGRPLVVLYNGLTTSIQFTDPHDLLLKRVRGITPVGLSYWVATVQPARANATTAPTGPRWEITPTPTANASDVITLLYMARWTPLVLTTDEVDLPDYAINLLIAYCRAFAESYDNSGASDNVPIRAINITDLLAEVESGPVFDACMDEDRAVQTDYGVLANGLVESMQDHDRIDYLDGREQVSGWIT